MDSTKLDMRLRGSVLVLKLIDFVVVVLVDVESRQRTRHTNTQQKCALTVHLRKSVAVDKAATAAATTTVDAISS